MFVWFSVSVMHAKVHPWLLKHWLARLSAFHLDWCVLYSSCKSRSDNLLYLLLEISSFPGRRDYRALELSFWSSEMHKKLRKSNKTTFYHVVVRNFTFYTALIQVVCITFECGMLWIAQFKLVYGCSLSKYSNIHERTRTTKTHKSVKGFWF